MKTPTTTPTDDLTNEPTDDPTGKPTEDQTDVPTKDPTGRPTKDPTDVPTKDPTGKPTKDPTDVQTEKVTEDPTGQPTKEPTVDPPEDVVIPRIATDTPVDSPQPAVTEDSTNPPRQSRPKPLVEKEKCWMYSAWWWSSWCLWLIFGLICACIIFEVDRSRDLRREHRRMLYAPVMCNESSLPPDSMHNEWSLDIDPQHLKLMAVLDARGTTLHAVMPDASKVPAQLLYIIRYERELAVQAARLELRDAERRLEKCQRHESGRIIKETYVLSIAEEERRLQSEMWNFQNSPSLGITSISERDDREHRIEEEPAEEEKMLLDCGSDTDDPDHVDRHQKLTMKVERVRQRECDVFKEMRTIIFSGYQTETAKKIKRMYVLLDEWEELKK